jgi:hypothetical protein
MADVIDQVRWTGSTAVVTLPEHIDSSNAGQIREQLLRIIDRGAAVLVADLGDRTALLREQVAQTAHAISLAAADTAALLEQRAEFLERPRRTDYPAEIKRWCVLADQTERMAERWEHLQDQGTGVAGAVGRSQAVARARRLGLLET